MRFQDWAAPDADRGYSAIDITGNDARLYSMSCPLMVGQLIVGIPMFTKGKLTLAPKNREGQPLKSKVDALDMPRNETPDLLAPAGTMDSSSVATGAVTALSVKSRSGRRSWITSAVLPMESPGELPVIPVDERAAEVRAIKAV